MKKILLLLLTVISANAFGQAGDDSTGIKTFDKGLAFYNEGNLDSCVAVWIYLVENKIGRRYDTYGNAYFNIPTVYWQMKNYDKAKEWYKKLLASDLRDNDETGSLMEPHTNYKYKSALALAGLYEADSNYTAALEWLAKADTLYRYWGFEGSATNVSLRQSSWLEWKADVLRKMNRREEAIHAIVLELICSESLESFFSSSEDTLFLLIDKKKFKPDLDKSLENLSVQQLDSNNWKATFVLHGLEYIIPIGNIYPDRNLPHYWRRLFVNSNQVVDKTYVVNEIKERSFYRRLKE